jgi:hypothetical protein
MARSIRKLSAALVAAVALFARLAAAQTEIKRPAPLPREMPDVKTIGEVPVKEGAPPATAAELAPRVREIVERQTVGNAHARPVRRVELPDAVFHDEIDGSLWASSRRYKARFAATDVTFVPFLGSHAPGNFPLVLALEEVRAGGVPLVPAGAVLPVRKGDTIAYHRGLVTELYEVTTRHVEQKFVLRAWPGAGDLVVRMRVTTGLELVETPEGFRFQNALGGVLYGKATVLDSGGRAEPMASRYDDGAIELTVPAAFLAGAVYPVTIDPVLVPDLVEGGALNNFLPDVAYDATTDRWLVTFEEAFSATDHDIWAETRDANGDPIAGSGAYIDRSVDDWRLAKCAGNNVADNFLVVAQRRPVGGTAWAIWGRTRAAATGAMGGQFQISGTESGDKVAPDVGGDPNPVGPTWYCVVWQRNWSATDLDVHFRLVAPDGTFPGGVNSYENAGNRIDHTPTISKSDGGPPSSTQFWNLIWSYQSSPTDTDVYWGRIRWDGSVALLTSPFSLGTNDDIEPTITASVPNNWGPAFLATWENFSTGNLIGGIYTQGPSPPYVFHNNLSQILGQTEGIREASPSADTDGTRFALAFEELSNPTTGDWNVYVATVHLHTALPLMGVTDVPRFWIFPPTSEASPEVASAWSGGGAALRYGVAWDSYPTPANGNIWLGLYDGRTVGGGHSPGVASCGGLTLTAAGTPGLGAAVSYTLSGVQGAPLILFGIPDALPFCPACTIGVNLAGALIVGAGSFGFTVAGDTRLLGITMAVQGGDYPSAGGCPIEGGSVRTSNSVRITFQ